MAVFYWAESHTIILLSDSDTHDTITIEDCSSCHSEVGEHTSKIERQNKESAALLHNKDVMISTPTATEVSMPDNHHNLNTSR